MVALKDAAEIVSGGTPKSAVEEYWDGDIPWATPKDLSKLTGPFISTTPRNITDLGLQNSSATLLPANSVLFSSRAPIGYVAINTVAMATNQGFKSLVPKHGISDAGYLYHWLQANRTYLESLGNGATFKEVSKAVVAKVEIPLPPIEEQRRIAAILDHADALRTKRREALARLDELTQSIFIDMFGDALDTAPVVTVSDVAASEPGSMRTGPFGSQLLHEEFTESGVAVLGIDNAVTNTFEWGERRYISPAKYEQLRRFTVKPGDVLITIMGTCGRCAVVPEDIPKAINTKHLCCITLDQSKALPEFLHAYFLLHPAAVRYLRQSAKGAIMSGLNMGIIKKLPFPLVPVEIQRQFVARAGRIDTLRNAHRTALAELDALFASLQSRAFRGEL